MEEREVTISLPPEGIPLSQVPEVIQRIRGGKLITRQAVYLWVNQGLKGSRGNRVYLQTYKVAGKSHTKAEWIKEFLESI